MSDLDFDQLEARTTFDRWRRFDFWAAARAAAVGGPQARREGRRPVADQSPALDIPPPVGPALALARALTPTAPVSAAAVPLPPVGAPLGDGRFTEPPPAIVGEVRRLQRVARRLYIAPAADPTRPHLVRRRVGTCGLARAGEAVEVRRAGDGSHFVSGVRTCGSAWECPYCARRIRAARAEQLLQACAKWRAGGGEVYMVTLTLRHRRYDDLRALRAGLGEAWSRMVRGAPWKRFKTRIGFKHYARGMETTHGANGWHPHLHVLVFARPLSDVEHARMRDFIAGRWEACVGRALGPAHTPSAARGVEVSRSWQADYVSKLGLEVAGVAKDGRGASRSPWAILGSAERNAADGRLWRDYCNGMRGARVLTFSRGFAVDLVDVDQTDEELATDEPEAVPVVALAAVDWDRLVRVNPDDRIAMLLTVSAQGTESALGYLGAVLGPDAVERSRFLTADPLGPAKRSPG